MSEDRNALAEELSGDNENDVKNDTDGPGETEELKPEEQTNNMLSDDDPLSVKKRLGMQSKRHNKEMRALRDQLSHMQAMMGAREHESQQSSHYPVDNFVSPGQPNPAGMSEEAKIEHAVRKALGYQQEEHRKAQEAERAAHVHKQYQRLNDEFDKASDKYDDFDDVVRADDVPFTPHVRDALLLVENPAEVAYKLGKSRSELERISKLHPLDQAREVNKLSFSLLGGHEGKSGSQRTTPLGNVRANPGASQAITGKTPVASIRARMKAGDWK